MKFYSYWRSSAAFRVRIALALKGIHPEFAYVHLIKDGGQQKLPTYKALNPAGLVPLWQDDELTLNQSLAILQYLEDTHPAPALLPADHAQAAMIRAFSLDIACDIHPLNNLRVLQYLTGTLGVDEAQKLAWIHHWLQQGFTALEQRLVQQTSWTGPYCFGNTPSWADICLVPQIYNALRFGLEMTAYPRLWQIYQHCMAQDAFAKAAPEAQADAQPS